MSIPPPGWKTEGALARFEIFHPTPDRVCRLLSSLALDAPVSVLPAPSGTPARLAAHIGTPQGVRVLSAGGA